MINNTKIKDVKGRVTHTTTFLHYQPNKLSCKASRICAHPSHDVGRKNKIIPWKIKIANPQIWTIASLPGPKSMTQLECDTKRHENKDLFWRENRLVSTTFLSGKYALRTRSWKGGGSLQATKQAGRQAFNTTNQT